MEKKLRITLPESIFEIIVGDSSEFKVTKNYIFNYIFEHLKDEKIEKIENMEKRKKVIQFNLNKKNKENYYNFLEEKNIQVEAEYFRNLFIKYASQTKRKRELFIYKEKVERIELAIEEKKVMKIIFLDGKEIVVEPYFIGNSKLEIANYIFCYDIFEKKFKNYKLSNIKSVYVKQEIFTVRDRNFIEGVKRNFDPFLSQGKKIKVALTDMGQKIFKEIKLNRPEVLRKDGNIYELQCSQEKAKRYFSYFLDEAVILEPEELKEWFIEKYKKALLKYENRP